MPDFTSLCGPNRSWNSMAEISYDTCHIQLTKYFRLNIYFDFFFNYLNGKYLVVWKSVKTLHWQNGKFIEVGIMKVPQIRQKVVEQNIIYVAEWIYEQISKYNLWNSLKKLYEILFWPKVYRCTQIFSHTRMNLYTIPLIWMHSCGILLIVSYIDLVLLSFLFFFFFSLNIWLSETKPEKKYTKKKKKKLMWI